jgi:hypothetical protein
MLAREFVLRRVNTPIGNRRLDQNGQLDAAEDQVWGTPNPARTHVIDPPRTGQRSGLAGAHENPTLPPNEGRGMDRPTRRGLLLRRAVFLPPHALHHSGDLAGLRLDARHQLFHGEIAVAVQMDADHLRFRGREEAVRTEAMSDRLRRKSLRRTALLGSLALTLVCMTLFAVARLFAA